MSSPDFSSLSPGCTKSEAAVRLYPGLVFDCTLPQSWVDTCLKESDFDVRPHFVWGYPNGLFFGNPYPVSQTGANFLKNFD
jgi:hypothetical protein